jgi:hypothetical protein
MKELFERHKDVDGGLSQAASKFHHRGGIVNVTQCHRLDGIVNVKKFHHSWVQLEVTLEMQS